MIIGPGNNVFDNVEFECSCESNSRNYVVDVRASIEAGSGKIPLSEVPGLHGAISSTGTRSVVKIKVPQSAAIGFLGLNLGFPQPIY